MRCRTVAPYCACAPTWQNNPQRPRGGGILHRHGEVSKRVKDINEDEVTAIRYLCIGCGRAFTHYPQDVDRNGRSVRLRALMWALGLSHMSVGCVLTALMCPASRMSIGGLCKRLARRRRAA